MKKERRVLLSIPACAVTPKAAPEWGVGDSQKAVVRAVDSQALHKADSSRGRCGVAEGWHPESNRRQRRCAAATLRLGWERLFEG